MPNHDLPVNLIVPLVDKPLLTLGDHKFDAFGWAVYLLIHPCHCQSQPPVAVDNVCNDRGPSRRETKILIKGRRAVPSTLYNGLFII